MHLRSWEKLRDVIVGWRKDHPAHINGFVSRYGIQVDTPTGWKTSNRVIQRSYYGAQGPRATGLRAGLALDRKNAYVYTSGTRITGAPGPVGNTNEIWRAAYQQRGAGSGDLAGGTPKFGQRVLQLATDQYIQSIAVDWHNERVYLMYFDDTATPGDIRLGVVNYDGTGFEEIHSWDPGVTNGSTVIYGGDMFWSQDGDPVGLYYIKNYVSEETPEGHTHGLTEIRRIQADGSGDTLVVGPIGFYQLVIDEELEDDFDSPAGHVGSIVRIPDGMAYTHYMGANGGVFFDPRNGDGYKLKTVSLNGSGETTILEVSPAEFPTDPAPFELWGPLNYDDLAVDWENEHLYFRWTASDGLNNGIEVLERMAFDGTGKTRLLDETSPAFLWPDNFQLELGQGFNVLGPTAPL